MRRYALLGERLGHSYSVPIHQAIFRALGLEADYRLLEIPRGELGMRFPALCRELDGMNVTIPYKEEVMPLLDGVDDFARQVGAVNTVLCRDGASRGYNTDVAGFMLRTDFPVFLSTFSALMKPSSPVTRSSTSSMPFSKEFSISVTSSVEMFNEPSGSKTS